MRRKSYLILFLFLSLSASCTAPFRPKPIADTGITARAKTETQAKLTVSVLALGPKESEEVFGLKLAKKGIQPVWLRITNADKEAYWLIPNSLDPEYFSPNEAAQKNHGGHSKEEKKRIDEFFNEKQIAYYVPAGGTNEGYIFTQLSHGAKEVVVDLFGDKEVQSFSFVVPVPGLKVDYDQIDFDKIYSSDEYRNVTLAELKTALEEFPCCTFNKKGDDKGGDAVNFAMIGEDEDIFAAFIRRNWRQTEVRYKSSIFKTLKSLLFKSEYDNSPVSDLFLLGRHQDVAFQKPRKTIHFRNHLRMWMTTLRYKGKPVWLGAISRDIGLKASRKGSFFVTHRIDPDVDEARDYLLNDFLIGGALERFAYVKGGKESTFENPRKNFTGDYIYTDGMRAVMFISDKHTSPVDVDYVDWEYPKER